MAIRLDDIDPTDYSTHNPINELTAGITIRCVNGFETHIEATTKYIEVLKILQDAVQDIEVIDSAIHIGTPEKDDAD